MAGYMLQSHLGLLIRRLDMDRRGCVFVCTLFCLAIGVRGQVGTICRPNERFLSCGSCQRTCRDPAPECEAICRTGCYCPEDQVRNDTGHCVNLSECPPVPAYMLYSSEPHSAERNCPEDEEYKFCEPCNRTCDNPNPICPAQCGRGCFCRDGLVRNREGRCVPVEQCFKSESSNLINPIAYQLTCGPNQVYHSCRLCEGTCSSATPVCRTSCVAGCFCEPGYLKSPSGECVKLEDCPRAELTLGGVQEPSIEDCSSDEIYLSCGWCEPSCWEPRPECPLGVCTRGCLCRPPLLRHHSGHCVEEKDCAPQKCSDPDEEFVCRYGCEARCGSVKCTVRPRRCVLGCHCKLGLLRDVTGKCVTAEQCSITSQEYPFNITKKPDVTFLPNGKPKQHPFYDDTYATEDSSELIINLDNSTHASVFKNMSNQLPLQNGRLGVFPPIHDKTSSSRKFFEEAPYSYGKMDTTSKPLVEIFSPNVTKKSIIYPDLEYITASDNYQSTLDTSRTTDEMTLANSTVILETHSTVKDVSKIDFLDKTTVKINSETIPKDNGTAAEIPNVTIVEEVNKTSDNPSPTITPTSSSHTSPINKVLMTEPNDITPIRVPVNRKQYKPYKDVLSRAVKFYKDFVASTPSSYLDMNVINFPLSYRMGERHPLFPENPIKYKEQDKSHKNHKDTSPAFTSFMDIPFTSKSPKDLQYGRPSVSSSNFFNLGSNPFMKNSNSKSAKEENFKDTIVSNILNVMREILPSPVNFTIVNIAK